MSYKFDCLWFSGYKPCRFKRPCLDCPSYAPVDARICIISLAAMGAVLRTTCLLPAIRRTYKNPHITWITLPECVPLLENNPMIHRILTVGAQNQSLFSHLEFDVLYAVDKSLEAGALAESVNARVKFGFGLTKGGAIRPLSPEADYLFAVGLDDELKFRVNAKPETQMITETMGLSWQRDPYILELSANECTEVQRRRLALVPAKTMAGVIGFNTGCSDLFPYKKFTVEKAIELVGAWRHRFPNHAVALLGGGRPDAERQRQIKELFSSDPLVVNTPATEGLRSGILWLDTVDMLFSGCSLGMHIGIALKKPTVAWFGVSCIQEVDLYDRGVKLQSPVPCSPCWRKSCDNTPKCFDSIPVPQILEATEQCLKRQ